MKRMRIMGLCLFAAFAMSAVVVTTASGFGEPPEVGRCLKLAGGHWKDGACKKTSATEKKFEFYPAFKAAENGEPCPPASTKAPCVPKLKYTSAAKPSTLIQLETVGGTKIACTNQTATGEVTGPKTNIAQNIVFTGCETSGAKCKSTNPAATNEGEIKVKELSGLLGIEKVGTKTPENDKVANLFVPKTGEIFTEFNCAGVPVIVRNNTSLGGVMNNVTANAMKGFPTAATVKFVATKGKQKPEKFASDPAGTKRVLFSNKLGGEFEQAGQSLTTLQKNEEKLSINTSV